MEDSIMQKIHHNALHLLPWQMKLQTCLASQSGWSTFEDGKAIPGEKQVIARLQV